MFGVWDLGFGVGAMVLLRGFFEGLGFVTWGLSLGIRVFGCSVCVPQGSQRAARFLSRILQGSFLGDSGPF